MDVTDESSPVRVNIRQTSFFPDADVREWLDTYVPAQGMSKKGYLQRLIRDDMARIQAAVTGTRPKAVGRKDVAPRSVRRIAVREMVPIEDMAIA